MTANDIAYVILAVACGSLLIIFNRAIEKAFRSGRRRSVGRREILAIRVFYVALGLFVIGLGVRGMTRM